MWGYMKTQPLSMEERVALPIFKQFFTHITQWANILGLTPTHRIIVIPCLKTEMSNHLSDAFACTEWFASDASVIVKFNIDTCKDKSRQFIESVARHELMHILISPIDDEISKVLGDRGQPHNKALYDAIELVADRLAQYFNRVRGEYEVALIGDVKADTYDRP